jgi:hypothetical protein
VVLKTKPRQRIEFLHCSRHHTVHLTFASSLDKFTAVKQTRLLTAFLCVLYVAVACGFGLLHDHHDGNAKQHCAACAWLIKAVSDVPVTVTPVSITALTTDSPVVQSALLISALFLPASSRAPPLAPA